MFKMDVIRRWVSGKSIGCILFMSTLFSCSDKSVEMEAPRPGENSGEEVSLYLSLKNSDENLRTRAVDNEKSIYGLDIFVLENDRFRYKAEYTKESNDKYKVSLKTSSGEVKLLVFANAGDGVPNFTPYDDTREVIIKNMNRSFSTSGIHDSLPMAGEYTFPNGITSATTSSVNMRILRAVARADVRKNVEVENFRLTDIRLFRANNKIQYYPNYLSDPANPKVTRPSIPDGANRDVATEPIYITGEESIAELYIPEARRVLETERMSTPTCIVVGGLYKDGDTWNTDTSYYRIDFYSAQDTSDFGEILRNHRYNFTINSVIGKGKGSPEAAATEGSAGMTIEIQNWEEESTYMVFDGTNYFGLSSRNAEVNYRKNSRAFIDIFTDLDEYKVIWATSAGNMIGDESAASDSIANALFNVVIKDGRLRIESLTENSGTNVISEQFLILAKQWKILVRIEQTTPPDYSKMKIRILSIGTDLGSYGGNLPGSINSGRSRGWRPILLESSNFGPTGVVKIEGIVLDYITYGNINNSGLSDSQLDALLETFDVVNVCYGSRPNERASQAILRWIQDEDHPHRMLWAARDSDNSNLGNENMNKLLGEGLDMWVDGADHFVLAEESQDNDYFLNSGPFGKVNVSSRVEFIRKNDNILMAINANTEYAKTLTPLLLTDAGNYMISIDKAKRIVYFGDCNIQDETRDDNGFPSPIPDYPQAIFVANFFAWCIEEVILPGKNQ